MARHEDDLQIAREVVAGSIEAWHRLVERYSSLIYSMERRYLPGESDEVRRTVFVDTLKSLYEEKLAAYDGSSALSTWISLITRRMCVDHLRQRLGRQNVPVWLAHLSERERDVYRLYYLEGLSYAQICAELGDDAVPLPVDELIACFSTLDEKMTPGLRRRLAYDLHARSSGEVLGRVAEFVDTLRAEQQDQSMRSNPDVVLENRVREESVARIRQAMAELPESDQAMLEMFFFRGWTARRIADDQRLSGQRRAYTLINRSVRRLRRVFEAKHAIDNPRRYPAHSAAEAENSP